MSTYTYNGVKLVFNVISSVFFRETRVTGVHLVPKDDPCIFVVAPHSSQFVDPGMVLSSCPRSFAPLMAQSSFKRKVIGTAARLLNAIPVVRPQDLATKGTGRLTAKDSQTIVGKGTRFTQEVGPRDLLVLSKTLKLEVLKVDSDTEITLKAPLDEESIELLSEGLEYKIIPHVDQHVLYEKVHERLAEKQCIVIFPEGGSHDRTEMLPLKAGFAIMALGAMAAGENIDVKIVPVGLNYFHPHRFRSRAVVSYGSPISVKPEWVQKYKEGGPAKREAIAALLDAGYDGLKSVTANAPDYDTLMALTAARRLYRPAAEHKLRLDQVVELNRRFLLGYKHFENDPRLIELLRKVKAYNNTLKYFGLRDHQVERTETSRLSASTILGKRLLMLLFLSLFGLPALLFNCPIVILALIISEKKRKEALAGSSVKIAARDVIATWKVLVTLIVAPALYGLYSCILFGYLRLHYPEQSLLKSFSIAFVTWLVQPFLQYFGVRLLENGLDIYRSLKPLVMAMSNPDGAAELRNMRQQLSEHITNFVMENGPVALEDFDAHKYDNLEARRKSWRGLLGGKMPSDRSLFHFSGHSEDSDDSDGDN
ncbi:hypothetical protein EC973_001334 [Apophysomyces ossiformis]|uniref:Phospholipid/glycerol acyltransferase domain-containing protein n=1 Tax=Apophysomyces ossiformis TaxID=679940 RepID=A0A8H7ES82_9FUNG|nr:hypothetical protein EC973_001334 [Apophysomyces ossiformis]